MDYRKILKAYLEHINALEGTDFLYFDVEGLTADECAELKAMGDAAYAASKAAMAETIASVQAKLEEFR